MTPAEALADSIGMTPSITCERCGHFDYCAGADIADAAKYFAEYGWQQTEHGPRCEHCAERR